MAREVNKNYKRSTFNTMIDDETQRAFSARCREEGMKMNIVIEYFMKEYLAGNFEITLLDKRKLQKDVYLNERKKRLDSVLDEVRQNSNFEVDEWANIKGEIEEILNG